MLDLLSTCIDQHSQTYIWTVHECTLSLSVIFDFRKNKLWAQRSMCEFRFSKDTFAHKCTSIFYLFFHFFHLSHHKGSISKCTFISNGPNMINPYENSYYVIVDQMILVIKELFNDNFTVYFVSSDKQAIIKDFLVHNPSEICRQCTKIYQFNKSENLLLQTSMRLDKYFPDVHSQLNFII